jgi:hypothetical protein
VRAQRAPLRRLKHSFEKTGDNWEPKGRNCPSDQAGGGRKKAAGTSTLTAAKDYLMDVPKKFDIRGWSRMSKADLIDAIQKANAVRTRRPAASRRSAMGLGILSGAAAGAAGTVALDAATYLDMTVRGRPSSTTPQQTIEAIEQKLPVSVPGDDDTRSNRITGLSSLSGIATGIGVGVVFGVLRRLGVAPPLPLGAALVGLGAMAATDLSMTGLKVTDPRTWSTKDWLSDLLPHLVYGAVTYATLRALDRDDDS